jgi:hypothetical protein
MKSQILLIGLFTAFVQECGSIAYTPPSTMGRGDNSVVVPMPGKSFASLSLQRLAVIFS